MGSVCALGLCVVVVALGFGVDGWVALGWVGALELELELGLVWEWEGNAACCGKYACGGGSRCGSIGREALVLVFRCVCSIIEKSFRERVVYWWVVGGGHDLGG